MQGVAQSRQHERLGEPRLAVAAADQQPERDAVGVAVGVLATQELQPGTVDRRQVAQIDEHEPDRAATRLADRVTQAHRGVGVDLATRIELDDHPVHTRCGGSAAQIRHRRSPSHT